MKRVLLILALLLCAPQSVSAGSLAKAPNNLGLVGYWSFNEGTGLKAGDYSGNGNTGTLTGGPTWSGGKFGGGLNFDGTNDYVDFGASNTLNVYQNATFTLWFRQLGDAGGSYQPFIQRFGAAVTGYQIFSYNSNDTICFYTSSIVCSTYVIGDSNWHHLAITNDGTTTRFYVDGVARGSATQSGVNITTATVNTIGNYAGNYFNGSLDDVRIYNRALGANEIARLYNTGGVGKIQSAQSEAGTGLVGHWKLDDRAGTRATDSSGRGNHGTLTGGSLWTSGKLGGALNFDGTDDYVTIPDSPAFDLLNFTVGAWIKIDGSATGDRRVVNQQGGDYWLLHINGNRFAPWLSRDGLGGGTYGPVLNDGGWHMILFTRDTVNNVVTLWVDGVVVGTVATTDDIAYAIAANISIGSYVGSSQFFQGSIDDVRIYNTALTAQQVKTLYASGTARPAIANANSASLTAGTNLASGLVGHWSFDGKYLSPTTARDSSGQGNDGTLTNGPAVAIGKMGQALSFDGGNDYVAVVDSDSLDTTTPTISAWIKTIDATSGVIFSHYKPTANYDGFGFGIGGGGCTGQPSGRLTFWSSGQGSWIGSTSGSVNDGNWHHVVATHNGVTLAMYIDGASVYSGAVSAPGVTTNSAHIGVDGALTFDCYFNGSLDDVRIYNRALSATEVKQLYYLGK